MILRIARPPNNDDLVVAAIRLGAYSAQLKLLDDLIEFDPASVDLRRRRAQLILQRTFELEEANHAK